MCLHCLGNRYYISLLSPLTTDNIVFCTSYAYKTYFKAEFDVETAVRGTTVLGAKAVTADVAHTAANAKVNFMIVGGVIVANYEARKLMDLRKCDVIHRGTLIRTK